MSTKVTNSSLSEEVRTSDCVGLSERQGLGPRRVSSDPVGPSDEIGPLAWGALVKGHGSVKVTSAQMGQKDPSQLKREICDEQIRLRDLARATPAALCELGQALIDRYGHARKSKTQIALEQLAVLQEAVAVLQRTLISTLEDIAS